ncbi:hypothetical protein Anas_08517 [Armadillidium nasatum]|uniref:Uncharacterized protein n=1 Tax=Armadillidium nasatum TaxID=96803 RepID=A0A5N5TLB1_9CRUS|nr:hypothetical protein Anas_08517 [Armadillidium nasatum]
MKIEKVLLAINSKNLKNITSIGYEKPFGDEVKGCEEYEAYKQENQFIRGPTPGHPVFDSQQNPVIDTQVIVDSESQSNQNIGSVNQQISSGEHPGTFANETAQFLAPFDQSSSRTGEEMQEIKQESSSEFYLNNKDQMSSVCERVTAWNPFNDTQPFSQMSEDHIFGAEFDKIRQGSQSSSESSIKVYKDDDPFGSAPFNYSGDRLSKCSKQSEHVNLHSSNSEILMTTSQSPPQTQPPHHGDGPSEANSSATAVDFPFETLQQDYVRPPLEDRSKYEKLQNIHDEESDEDPTSKDEKAKKHPIRYLPKKRVLGASHSGRLSSQNKSSNVVHQQNHDQYFQYNKTSGYHIVTTSHKEYADADLISGNPPPALFNSESYDKALRKRTLKGEVDDAKSSENVFECNVSEDDSIGSASDLKARIDEECDYYYCDRGDASETISSSVYYAECESVTTHEDDGRHDYKKETTGVPVATGARNVNASPPQRGPKPTRSALRARAKAIREQESRKSSQDRLLGHEYGEKPLLLDDELDSGDDDRDEGETTKENGANG